ncbi:MAG: glycosyltransferase [Verrucomicrobiota bacterium]|nr:glycosyltransferase [Verrucomicrobiota bacterium]
MNSSLLRVSELRMNSPLKVAYLFTTFPLRTETFLQREVRSMRALGVDVRLYSLWGGADSFEGLPIRRLHIRMLPQVLFWYVPLALLRDPRELQRVLALLWSRDMTSALDVFENLWGWAAALMIETALKREKPDWIHAVWSTMPAAAALLLSRKLQIPWSFGAHAYDVFEHGGDMLLKDKAAEAAFIHTSTRATADGLVNHAVPARKIILIRRGLDTPMPELKSLRANRTPMRLLNVGRLVPKKGHALLLRICAALDAAGVAFEARIVGGGSLHAELTREIERLGLVGKVTLLGAIDAVAVSTHYEWADILLFTGTVAPNGDRDGLPNVIPEAMARGLPVLATNVGGVSEAIDHTINGFLLDPDDVQAWVLLIRLLSTYDELYERIGSNAHEWAITHFNAIYNAEKLLSNWSKHVGKPRL